MKSFWDKVDKKGPGGCWLWKRCVGDGYGQAFHTGTMWLAHRLAYYLTHGTLPEKPLQFDHTCRVRHCVNPDHLDIVTNKENHLRGERANRTHCPQAHKYTKANTRICTRRGGHEYRKCRQCGRDHAKRKSVARMVAEMDPVL